MKKLLSLLTAVTLTTSGTSGVISCGSEVKTPKTDQQKADAIKAKIQNTSISIQGASIVADTNQSPTKTAIDAALKKANNTLTDDDLTKILYSGTLKPNTATDITATITVGSAGAKATKTLSITWNLTDQQKADAIKAKIQNTEINLIINATGQQKISDYKTNIKTELDQKLTTGEKNAYDIDFINPNQLLTSSLQDIKITIKVGPIGKSDANIKVKFNFKKIAKLGNSIIVNSILNTKTQSSNDIFVGTKYGGLYKSTDGISFNPVTITGLFGLVNTIQKVGKDASLRIYIGTTNGLWVSSDETGTSFSKVQGDPSTKNITTIQEIDNKIYVGTTSGFYFKNKNGSIFLPIDGMSTDDIKIIKKIDSKIYVGTNSNGLYVSNDATGTSFSKASSIIPNNLTITIIQKINSTIYVGTKSSLYYSNDNGVSFYEITGNLQSKNITTIQQIGSKIYVGTNSNGLYVSNDATGTSYADGLYYNFVS